MRLEEDRGVGCLLGLALGDALGAPFEGGPIERLLWRVVGRTREGRRRFTDDTQMSLDLAESWIANGGLDLDDLARRFAASYRWSRGYGPSAARLLRAVARGADWREASRATHAEGSFGNGAAMRAPVLGIALFERPDDLAEVAASSARVTHAHPLGVEGARLIAAVTREALAGDREFLEVARARAREQPYRERLAAASGVTLAPAAVREALGNGIAALDSCVTALYLAQAFVDREFEELISLTRELGGDVDTIGAMAGAVWGASRGAGALPAEWIARLEQHERIAQVARALVQRVNSSK